MSAGILVDTNVLIYAFDRSAPGKQPRAIETLTALHDSGRGRLGAQCLAEFFSAATKGSRRILTVEEAERETLNFVEGWPVLNLTVGVIREALRGVRQHRMPYWDAQIWAAARLHQCEAIFSEDFANGSRVEGVHFANPFASDFQLGEWV